MLFLRLCVLNEALADVQATVDRAEREVIGIHQSSSMMVPGTVVRSHKWLQHFKDALM